MSFVPRDTNRPKGSGLASSADGGCASLIFSLTYLGAYIWMRPIVIGLFGRILHWDPFTSVKAVVRGEPNFHGMLSIWLIWLIWWLTVNLICTIGPKPKDRKSAASISLHSNVVYLTILIGLGLTVYVGLGLEAPVKAVLAYFK